MKNIIGEDALNRNFAKMSLYSDKSIDNDPTCNTTPSRRFTEHTETKFNHSSKKSKFTTCPNKIMMSGYLTKKEIKRKRTRNWRLTMAAQDSFDPNLQTHDSIWFNEYLIESPVKLYSSIKLSNELKSAYGSKTQNLAKKLMLCSVKSPDYCGNSKWNGFLRLVWSWIILILNLKTKENVSFKFLTNFHINKKNLIY